ncbi:hypothetical protein G7Z17_g1465 [Cylindrodendrum hubeiense]|uniref:Uncharacterized protein n=1 Tax=Cylindrodendrum hubeiense TaxID=595255 RepID=A0A9P5HEX5_9HYPO|nr:hypothetical protein G7Z17_g1465 [Cylindrodendrum hubeiense]
MGGYSHLDPNDGDGTSQDMPYADKSPSTLDHPISPLPPKQLAARGRLWDITLHFLVAVGTCLVSILAVMYGVKVYDGSSRDLGYEDKCETETASEIEKAFIIDIRIAKNFTFVQAKLIDLLWDVIIGQGGRALHAWILYRYVARDALTRIMEYMYYDTELIGDLVNETIDMSEDFGYWTTRFGTSQRSPTNPPSGIPTALKGWEFKDQGKSYEPVSEWESWQVANYTLDSNNATFLLNRTITQGEGVLPYNSTFTYDNETFELQAPFLDIGKGCKEHRLFFTNLGNCVCYRGQPLEDEFFLPDNLRCVQRHGYVWGLSAVMALIGLCIEAVWVIGCWGLWLDAQVNSELVKFRRGGGDIRASLDLAESVKRDLGANTSAYSDAELSKDLDKCEPVGYSVEERDGASHIVLVPARMQSKIKIRDGRLYGGIP